MRDRSLALATASEPCCSLCGSGYIDKDELTKGVQHFNLPIPIEHVHQIAEQMDRGDGKIDYVSFAAHLHEKDQQTHDLWKYEGHAVNKVRPQRGGVAPH